MKEILFEADGIIVYAEDGTVYEMDDQNTYEFEDTEANRAEAVADAKATVEAWKA